MSNTVVWTIGLGEILYYLVDHFPGAPTSKDCALDSRDTANMSMLFMVVLTRYTIAVILII